MFDMAHHALTRIPPPARPRAKRKASELTRDKLIEAAGHVFAERGYRAATIRDICRRAGANVAAVNYTFGDTALKDADTTFVPNEDFDDELVDFKKAITSFCKK